MGLDIVQFLAGEDSGSHIAVLDPLIGEQRRRQIPLQVHPFQAL